MKLEIKYASKEEPKQEKIDILNQKALLSFDLLTQKTGLGNDFLGWIDLPNEITDIELEDIITVANKIRKNSKILVVAGIGGSYLGARAVIEALKNNFDYLLNTSNSPIVLYAGNTLSEDYLSDLINILDKKDYSLCVISKSGTTTETAVTFRILRDHLEKKYGHNEAVNRTIAITDKERGVLKQISDKEGYKTFVIPDDVGGRYSVLTPVGLLPIAVAGFDIKQLVNGAKQMRKELISNKDTNTNIALQYAICRNYLYSVGKSIELMVDYQPNMIYFSKWWKQLYGESEGKDGKGLFPASVSNTTDLHSMGQYIQQGKRLMFETVIHIENAGRKIQIPQLKEDDDHLDYLLKYSLMDINHKAEEGTRMAHLEGGVSQIKLSIDKLDANNLGQMIYFFEFACGISGYMLGVNPFNQPGVENYKSKMFTLLGRK